MNTRREISYPQEAMYYFVYHINTIALYRQEKSTSLMNESKRIDNLRIKIVKCVGVGKMKKAFKQTKLSVIDLVLTDRRNLLGTRPKSAYGKSSSFRFWFSAARNAITKATENVTFGFSFRILVFFLF